VLVLLRVGREEAVFVFHENHGARAEDFAHEIGASIRSVRRDPTDLWIPTRQKGMFSFSGLNRDQVEQLRTEHGVYIVGSGRINVAGMSLTTMPALCKSIVSVL
jgi:aspartate/tyrosine/aromatic aminotransferase